MFDTSLCILYTYLLTLRNQNFMYLQKERERRYFLKHPYLISKLLGVASKVTEFGEINSDTGSICLCYSRGWECTWFVLKKLLAMSECTWGNTPGFLDLTYRPLEVQLRCVRSMISKIKYTAQFMYKYRPEENRSHFKFNILCIHCLVEPHTFPHPLYSSCIFPD